MRLLKIKLKNPAPTVICNTDLDDGISMENEYKTPVGHRKLIFWQNSINDQRQKGKVCINVIFIEGLLDTGADVSIITPESWHVNWPLKEVDVQSYELETKHNMS